ncbi:hypothetical protein [Gordonia shandongensis]|uniref:hypothetical protein n=1 Tax=Gordonia shandongensis TaxID=376351 RepID=UPI0012EB3A24|nr:hypothetical protein [Gordonia shandongensis]
MAAPADHLAVVIAAAADDYAGQTLWATIGGAALTVDDLAMITLGPGQPLPRFVHPEVFDRLIRPGAIVKTCG